MSDALKYLIKARPEAMGAYFSFLKETGKHLDPKTRSLISVITKVDSQTERGLRQYLPRALPEFRLELLGAEVDWHDLISVEEVKDGDITYVEEIDGRSVFIYRSGDEYRVYDSRCPHQVTNIPHLASSGRLRAQTVSSAPTFEQKTSCNVAITLMASSPDSE